MAAGRPKAVARARISPAVSGGVTPRAAPSRAASTMPAETAWPWVQVS